ncbi:MAG: tRNA dihydrouridine synthase DusB [Ignavibacteria bacterium]|nr:tRNA dihydrouridine synthase DusB [Ignavibacteria bacterium]MBI3765481.1 tRNA dihydrouridine synthase DusB [Ignavibacteriales bacterium]
MKIGTIDIPQAILLAPMEDVTDISFRLMCKRLGADIMYTEFVNSEGLIRQTEKTKQKMMFLPQERPFGIQIYGGKENSMARAACMAEELHPDLIDINCGCWVRNVAGHGAGAGLLRDLPKMQRIVREVVKSVSLPVTVKTRLGWDTTSIQIIDVARMIEDTGAQALTVHCRTRAQGHKGDPDYSWIPSLKQAVCIPIIVNGGVDCPEMAKRVFDTTGCDGVMVARGAIQNPWIFSEIKHYLVTGKLLPEPSLRHRIEILLEHLNLSVRYKGERSGVIEFRKHYSGYLRNQSGISKVRAELMQFTELPSIIKKLREVLDLYPVHDRAERNEHLAA